MNLKTKLKSIYFFKTRTPSVVHFILWSPFKQILLFSSITLNILSERGSHCLSHKKSKPSQSMTHPMLGFRHHYYYFLNHTFSTVLYNRKKLSECNLIFMHRIIGTKLPIKILSELIHFLQP